MIMTGKGGLVSKAGEIGKQGSGLPQTCRRESAQRSECVSEKLYGREMMTGQRERQRYDWAAERPGYDCAAKRERYDCAAKSSMES